MVFINGYSKGKLEILIAINIAPH